MQEGDPEDWWQETFKSHVDSKPNGPEGIAFDVTFSQAQHVYGLPEHATSFALKPTTGTQPYYRFKSVCRSSKVVNMLATHHCRCLLNKSDMRMHLPFISHRPGLIPVMESFMQGIQVAQRRQMS